jgi:hypothetical protein
MTLINNTGSKIIGMKPKLSQDQLAVIDICKETLARALEGDISSIGIVACLKGGYATVVAGKQASDLFMGCASLQRKILSKVEISGAEAMRSAQIPPDFPQ